MYSILHIPSGHFIPIVDCKLYNPENSPGNRYYDIFLSETFYSFKDCWLFVKNFISFDKFQRGMDSKNNLLWLQSHNRFTYLQYSIIYNRITCKPHIPKLFTIEEFLIIKLNKGFGREWREFQP